MHPAAVNGDAAPLPRRAAREAAAWLLRLQAGADAATLAACARWRAAHADHERAWQRALELQASLGRIPAALGMRALDRGVRHERRRIVKTLALLIVVGPAGWAASRALPWRAWTADYRSAVGEIRELRLADGSRLTLNTASAATAAFDDALRLLRLVEGEILVETAGAAGETRPFVVATPQGHLRALGTRFTVRRLGDATRLAVFDGAVEIRSVAARVRRRVEAHEAVSFTEDEIGAVVAADERSAGWRAGVLYADRMRLADFAAELDRYRHGVLRCDSAIAELRISGAFQLRDPERVLAVLGATLPVRVVYRSRWWATLEPAAA
ncbi:FecR domain-containing protein [Solimonas soli]|uniref:FecR domain-containing protein n=1 Tax=Solimonas soli TaxID=413479 RepID=UPI000685A27A|nr:FecR domain-containing protein [Solimonas soli]